MMAAILNSAMFQFGQLVQRKLELILVLTPLDDWQLILKSAKIWFPAILYKKNFILSFSVNLIMAAILNSAMFNLAILNSAILVFLLKLIHNSVSEITIILQDLTNSMRNLHNH